MKGPSWPVDPSNIVTEKCFVTKTNQVRKVTEIVNGHVNYLSRGAKSNMSWDFGPSKSAWPSIDDFASEVDREVRCDWDKDHSESKPS